MVEARYIHGASPEEQERLALMNSIINERCLPVVAPSDGDRILDVGAGTGIFARDLAEIVGPEGHVVGVEINPQQLAAAQKLSSSRLEFRKGDVRDLPLRPEERGTFDLVHSRFVLEHVADLSRVMQEMMTAARPGGKVVLIDDDHSSLRFYPPLEDMDRLWTAYYQQDGLDPFVGVQLGSLLITAGAERVQTKVINFGACASEPEFSMIVDNMIKMIKYASPASREGSSWTFDDVSRVLVKFQEWSKLPNACIIKPILAAVGYKKSSRPGALDDEAVSVLRGEVKVEGL